MKQLIDLHVHTMYSLLDSNNRPEEIVKRLKELKKPSVAITDHGNVYASTYMYKLLKKNDIKYLYGCELYICNDIKVKDKSNRYYHLIAIAMNEQGRLNLNKLISISNIDGFYYKPRIDFELLKQYKEGLIILSACMAGEISRLLMNDDYDKAKETALKYKKEFGDNYYLEYQSHTETTQQQLNRQIVDLAKELDINYVVTTDAHYLKKESQEYHSIFVQIGQEREVGETYNDCYFQTSEDVLEICKSTTEEENLIAIENTHKIANKCNVDIPLSSPIIPHVDIPKGFKNEIEYLQHLCVKGWKYRNINNRYKEKIQEYKDRLKYEMNAIDKMGFAGYFLLVYSYITLVERRGIARGSAGGSLVAYLLNIVDIDPIRYGLYFERFIDVGAIEKLEKGEITLQDVKIPDVDSDTSSTARETIIEFLISKYGRDRVVSLGTFQFIWAKGAIKDIGRVLDIPFEVTNEMTKKLDKETIEDALDLGLLDEYKADYPKLFEYAQQLAGLPKSFSRHACGKVISMKDIEYYFPINVNSDDGDYVIQGDMNDAENLGLVKVDLLGLRTVDVIYDTLEMIGKDYEYIKPDILDFEDKKVLAEFAKGNSKNIFQFESYGMRDTLKKMKVSGLDDLGIANALYRPGSMQFIDLYVSRKHGLESVEYIHQDLEEILSVTYGIIVFQEQLIEIGRLAGMNNPDLLRQATAKKKPELMAIVEPELREGLYKRGWSKPQVDELWNVILEFARYSFNKSHSYAYAIMAYICMYLKVYHPVEYMCAVLNSYQGDAKKIKEVLPEIRRLNINIKFDYKICKALSIVKDSKIYYGVGLIKESGMSAGDYIIPFQNKQYNYFIELLRDMEDSFKLNKKIQVMVKLGYFNSFYNTGKCLEIYEEFTNGKFRYKKDHKDGTKEKRFAELLKIEQSMGDITDNLKEKIKTETEFLNVPVSIEPKLSEMYYIVIDFKTYNSKNKPYIMLYQLATGEYVKTKVVDGRFYSRNSFKLFDILKIDEFQTQKKSKQVNGEWQKTDEDEQVLSEWQVF